MAGFKIVWSEFAEWNLDQIYNYILKHSFSKNLAKQFVLKLISRVEQLERFPFSGKEEPVLKGLGKEFRFLVFRNYKITYFVEGNKVYISDVFHTKLSPAKMRKRYK